MPSNHRLRLDDDQSFGPAWPNAPQSCPEQAIPAVQPWSRSLTLEYGDLLAQSEDFQRSVQPGLEQDSDGSQECEYQVEHESTVVAPPWHTSRPPMDSDRNLLVQMYDAVLATHKYTSFRFYPCDKPTNSLRDHAAAK